MKWIPYTSIFRLIYKSLFWAELILLVACVSAMIIITFFIKFKTNTIRQIMTEKGYEYLTYERFLVNYPDIQAPSIEKEMMLGCFRNPKNNDNVIFIIDLFGLDDWEIKDRY